MTLGNQLGYYRGENLELVWGRRGRLRERLRMHARVDGTTWSKNFPGRMERRRSSEVVDAALSWEKVAPEPPSLSACPAAFKLMSAFM